MDARSDTEREAPPEAVTPMAMNVMKSSEKNEQ
jgi:hypothetical protein